MIQALSSGIVLLHLVSFFVLGFVYASPYLQLKLKVKSEEVSKVISITIVYTIIIQVVFYILKQVGISETTFTYTADGLSLFYLVCLFGWFTLKGVEK